MPGRSHVVAVIGADRGLGRRVTELLSPLAAVDRVVDVPTGAVLDDGLVASLEGVDVVCHVAGTAGRSADGLAAERTLVEGTERLLGACGQVRHLVVVSSAAVYGAWPQNPIPLTEEAPVRPNPNCGFAVQRAEVERLSREWEHERPERTVTVLRPAVELDPDGDTWLARSLRSTAGIRPGGSDPPAQFVHLDDLASAVVLAATREVDAVLNVAAEGWLSGEQVRALTGTRHRVRVPEAVAASLAQLTWRWRIGRVPPGLLPYVTHPWVVATDRLTAEGWRAAHANDEALVDTSEGSVFESLSPGRRQQLAWAVAGGAVALAAAGVGGLLSRRRRRGGRRASR